MSHGEKRWNWIWKKKKYYSRWYCHREFFKSFWLVLSTGSKSTCEGKITQANLRPTEENMISKHETFSPLTAYLDWIIPKQKLIKKLIPPFLPKIHTHKYFILKLLRRIWSFPILSQSKERTLNLFNSKKKKFFKILGIENCLIRPHIWRAYQLIP